MATEVPKKLWEGRIPACFELATHENCSSENPSPYYTMISNNSYLTLFSEKLTEYFSSFVDTSKVDEIWFEFEGVPLHWHRPCGLLFDLHCKLEKDLPWTITVHFQNFPEKQLLRCPCEEAIQANFISSLKEADQLKHKGSVVNSMSKNQHSQLWYGIKTDNFNEFWTINRKFMDGFEGTNFFKNIPLCVYYKGHVYQKLIVAKLEDGEELTTLRHSLQTIDKIIFSDDSLENMKVVLQGTNPPLSSSIQWLSENMSYADNFLHVCVFDAL